MTRPGTATVLVLGVGGNVSQGIVKALRAGPTPVRIVAACISSLSAGLYAGDVALLSPRADAEGFVDWVADTCLREEVDGVFSGVEPVLLALAPHAGALRERTGAVVVTSPPAVLAIGQDKLLTARWLEERGLPYGHAADGSDRGAVDALLARSGFPVVVKPRAGKGAQGVIVAEDERSLAAALGEGMVVQQYLGCEHDEFTAGGFCDADGTVRGTIVMQRTLVSGTTVSARVGAFPEVREVAEAVVRALAPTGPCNVQMRVHDGIPTPFELNIRFSGTTPIRTRFGFGEVDLALRHLVLGAPAEDLPLVTEGMALRYWDELYVEPQAVAAIARDGRLEAPREARLPGSGTL
jgi:carbamoyl-phosphate synthase large subunit